MSASVVRDKRLDIQGLRALAVTLVVVFHLWPDALPGGFVGVDVFFVISGFLITAHLLSEVDRTKTVSVTRFWARRIRRLLPASFLVLAVSVVLAFTVMPKSVLQQNLDEIAASAAYVVNWVLAFNAVDYLASENASSLVQHYWSLSVEEQFYLIWPLLIVFGAWIAAKAKVLERRTVIGAILAIVFAVSLIVSIVWSNANPPFAYFATPTRAWEFAAGGLVAMVPAAVRSDQRSRVLLALGSWVALGLIFASALVLDGDTIFPGYIALIPVLGAAFLLWSGDDESVWSPQMISHSGPIQFTGDTSYSIYLWHWPLIIITPYLLDHPIGLRTGLAIIAVTLVLATLTKYLIEDPVRTAPGQWRLRWPAYTFMATGMAILLTIAPLNAVVVHSAQERLQGQADTAAACLGAPAMDANSGCAWSAGDFLTPSLEAAAEDWIGDCMTRNESPEIHVCESGADAAEATKTVALVGDSHMLHYFPAFEDIGAEEGWHVIRLFKGSCPFTDAVRSVTRDGLGSVENSESCVTWNESVREFLAARDDIDMVITSASSKNLFIASNDLSAFDTGVEGYLSAWSSLPANVKQVYVIRDVPRPRGDALPCLSSLPSVSAQLEYGACGLPRDESLLPDPEAAAAQVAGDRVELIDLSDLYCDDSLCLVVIGNVLVYRDKHHLGATFARSLEPYLRAGMGLTAKPAT